MSLRNKGEVEIIFRSGDAVPDGTNSSRLSPFIQDILLSIAAALISQSTTEANVRRLQTAKKILLEEHYTAISTRVRDMLMEAGIDISEFHADA